MARPKSSSPPHAIDSKDTSATATEGGRLAMTFNELLGDDETTDECASDIIRAIRSWRDVTSLRSLD